MALTNTEVYFEDISASICEKLSAASRSIRVAVAWFTDKQLFEILLQKASEQLDVIVIIRNDVINLGQSGLAWQKLIDAGGTLYFSPNSPSLHHKFCLIDDGTLLSGSYNWTYGAQRNRENVLFTEQQEVVRAFYKEFGFLLDSAREIINLDEALAAYPPVTNIELQQQAVVEATLEVEESNQQQIDAQYEELLQDALDAYRQKLHKEAEGFTQEAIKLCPKEPDAHRLLADIYWRTNENQKSIEAAKKVEEFGIQDTRLWNTYGFAYDGLKKHKEAIGYYDLCINKEPEVTTWYHNKCFALISYSSEKEGDKVALKGMEVARNEIKRARASDDEYRLMRVCIELGALKTNGSEARSKAMLAQEIYDNLLVYEQDLHHLDDIKGLLKRK